MANDTPKKLDAEKATETADDKRIDTPIKPPAPKQQATKPPEKPIAPVAKAADQKKPEAPKKIVPFDNNKVAQEAGKPSPAKTTAKNGKAAPQKKQETPAKKEKPAEKKAPVKDGPTLEERKAELEKELREKFGIPKTAKKVEPWVAPEIEQVVRIPHEEMHSFKDHPFNVEKNSKYLAFVASIRAQGVTQPAIVRPRDQGGYEIISGHRRDEGSKDAEIPFTPCIVRALNDDQAIQQMVEDNVNNRDIGTMELARALKMQLESIKHQGAQDSLDKKEMVSADDVGKRSNQVVAERNGMSVKQVQRHIALTNLVPALQEMVDGKTMKNPTGKEIVLKISFTPAVELSAIKQKDLQEYVAVAIEGQQAAPSLSQAQRMRQLADQKILNPDVIDGIMTEEKKEVDKVILSSQELSEYFGKEKTPREMKDTILKLLEEYKDKQKDIPLPEKKTEHEK